ncbi:hypothetical protein JXQ31_15535 [candidate division KSB1 bacterium]|nr:hypothetical protein [candidate division KSB1 bacterium]
MRLDKRSYRTVVFEMNALSSDRTAPAPAIFGPWMNISGSVPATWRYRKPVKDGRWSKIKFLYRKKLFHIYAVFHSPY